MISFTGKVEEYEGQLIIRIPDSMAAELNLHDGDELIAKIIKK